MSLQKYWPEAEEVNHCINHEAEGAHDAVLLAVHQPSPLTYRLISSDKKLEASEDELFKYLITNDVPSGAHLVPIGGTTNVVLADNTHVRPQGASMLASQQNPSAYRGQTLRDPIVRFTSSATEAQPDFVSLI